MNILSEIAGERMLRFDVDHDADVSIQDNWLSVTHTQTYAAALRAAVATYDEPCLLRLLFFGAVFCNKARGLDRRGYASPEPWPSHDGLDPLLSAVVEKRRTEAVSRMMAWIDAGADLAPLRSALMALSMSDVVTRPIVVAHVIKNTIVGFDEHRAMESPTPLLALIALLSLASERASSPSHRSGGRGLCDRRKGPPIHHVSPSVMRIRTVNVRLSDSHGVVNRL